MQMVRRDRRGVRRLSSFRAEIADPPPQTLKMQQRLEESPELWKQRILVALQMALEASDIGKLNTAIDCTTCVCVCVRACVRACVSACLRACVRACVPACMCVLVVLSTRQRSIN